MAAKLAVILLLGLVASALGSKQQQWQTGRATFYGKDGWSIHQGSCQYYYLDNRVGTGWDVAAASDTNYDYSNSCGKCKEVRCKPTGFNDGYGSWMDRASVCFDPSASVVVTVVDTCPCHYPGNYYSNKRWCCGDMYHMDLSIWAFEKLADTKWGVIALEWRDVDCSYQPAKPARNPWGQVSGPEASAPWGWQASMDKRIGKYGSAVNYSVQDRNSYGKKHL